MNRSDTVVEKDSVLPLINSSFQPGEAKEIISTFTDKDFQQIARAEYYYFSGQAAECSRIAEVYLMSKNVKLKMSACLLYAYSNLSLGKPELSRRGLEEIRLCLKNEMKKPSSIEDQAICVFSGYMASVLLHLPVDDLPDLKAYFTSLPQGIKLFGVYLIAHMSYLNGEYGKALGTCNAALLFSDGMYPISMIYLDCMIAMCQINLKQQEEAKEALMEAWIIAKKDGFFEPFIEHHGLLQGLLESCIRSEDGNLYKKLLDRIIAFSRGWMAIHNPRSENAVTDELSSLEFSIAMLASRGWSNQEIAEHLKISHNTVRNYLSEIYIKLGIKKRGELNTYMLK